MIVRVEINTPQPALLGAYLNGQGVAARWRCWVVLGAATLMLGLAAAILPWVAGVPTPSIIGAVLLGDGIAQGAHALQLRRYRGIGWRTLGALVSLGAGTLLLALSPDGLLTLPLLVGAFLLAAGVVKSFLATVLHPLYGWGWLLGDGLATALLGLTVLLLVPQAADWLLGFLLGATLLFDGTWLAVTALSARRLAAELGS
jgi:uncharacterized membrane protein HdeD (DUF308 family)